MKIIKCIFKWIGFAICLFLIFAFMQVPILESTPVYSIDSRQQFVEAFKHVNMFHNIFMIIIFTIITFIMEWYVCKWLNNKLDFSKRLSRKNLILSLGAGVFCFILQILTMSSVFVNAKPDVFTETLKTGLAVPLILSLTVIGPTLEELLFQAGIQKGVFKRLNPWILFLLVRIM